MSKIRATHVVRFDAGLFGGGGEVQAAMTARALAGRGISVEQYRPTSTDLGHIVHFFGNFDYFDEVASHARRLGIPYVVSPIFATSRSVGRLRRRAIKQRIFVRYRTGSLRLLQGAQRLLTLCPREESLIHAYYGDDLPLVVRIPNGVESRFASGDAARFFSKTGVQGPFALMVGALTPGKNQLPIIEACAAGPPLVVIGHEANAEYAAECRRRAGPKTLFIGSIPHDDPLLEDAYAAAHVLVHPSLHELFPLSPLEAGIAGARLLIADAWGSQQIFGTNAQYSRGCWRQDLERCLAMERPGGVQSAFFRATYSWDAVGANVASVYAEILGSEFALATPSTLATSPISRSGGNA